MKQLLTRRGTALALMGLLAATVCHAGDVAAAPEGIDRLLEEHAAVIEGMPAHPQSARLLAEAKRCYAAAGDGGEQTTLLRIARDLPDSNLGLYALRTWLPLAGEDAGALSALNSVVTDLPETRLAKYALVSLAARSESPAALLETFAGEAPRSVLGRFAARQLMQRLFDGGDVERGAAVLNSLMGDPALVGEEFREVLSRGSAAMEAAGQPLRAAGLSTSASLDPGVGRVLAASMAGGVPCFARRASLHEAIGLLEAGNGPGFLDTLKEAVTPDAALTEDPEAWGHLLLDTLDWLTLQLDRRAEPAQLTALLGARSAVWRALRDQWPAILDEVESQPALNAMYWRLTHAFSSLDDRGATGEVMAAFLGVPDVPFEIRARARLHFASLLSGRWNAHDEAARQAWHAAALPIGREARWDARVEAFRQEHLAGSIGVLREHLREAAEVHQHTPLRAVKLQVLDALCSFREGALAAAYERLAAIPLQDLPPTWQEHVGGLTSYMSVIKDDAQAVRPAVARDEDHIVLDNAFALATRGYAGPPRNVLLISLDTVRADALGCQGNASAQTPNLDLLARRGMRFTNARAVSSWTKPTHATVFTGLYPVRHGMHEADSVMPGSATTLAEVLRDHGYATGAFVAAPPLNSAFGFDRGFDIYDDFTITLDRSQGLFEGCPEAPHLAVNPGIVSGSTSTLSTTRAIQIMDALAASGQPFFMFLNLFDAHHDYVPPSRSESGETEAMGPLRSGRIHPWVDRADILSASLGAEDRASLRSLYDQEVTNVDAAVGRMLAHIEARGWAGNTVVVVFGDHGEEFFEHGGITHGRTLFEEQTHVPLIFAGPDVPVGYTGAPVSQVDLMPALLGRVGIPAPEGDGIDLFTVPLCQPRSLHGELNIASTHLRAVYEDGMKLIEDVREGSAQLYSLGNDHSEHRNLAAEQPEIVRRLRNSLATYAAKEPLPRGGDGKLAVDRSGEQVMEQVRALGYTGT